MFELLVSFLVVAATPYSPVTTLSAVRDGDEAVERAARDYRIQVYDVFHRNRSEYDSRSEAGNRVLSGYRRAGRRPGHREIIENWFVEAREASSPGQVRPLPDLPDFVAELPAEPPGVGRTADNTPVDGRQALSDVAVTSSPRAPVAEGWSVETSVAGKVGGALLRAAMKTPRLSAAEPTAVPQIHVSPPFVDSGELAAVEKFEPILVDTQDMVRGLPEKPGDAVSSPAEEQDTNELSAPETPPRPNTEQTVDPTPAPLAEVEPAPGLIQSAKDQDVPVRPSAASQRLTAKITDFNDSLHNLVEEANVDSPAKLFDVARLLNDLVDLAEQRREIASQLEAVPQADRDALPELFAIELAVTGLHATINTTRSELDAGELFDSDEERQQALQLLNVLENQLHTLSEEA